MKALYCLILIVSIKTVCLGQAYIPIPTKCASWDTRGTGLVYSTAFISICGDDTIFNSVAYKKVMSYFYDHNTGMIQNTRYQFAVRNDSANRKMYFVPSDDTVEHLLYDFNLNAGDSITMYLSFWSGNTKKVDSTWVAEFFGRDRKVIRFEPDFGTVEKWIEGIGSTYGFASRGRKLLMFDSRPVLACLYSNGRHVFTNNTYHVNVCRVFDCPSCPSINPPCYQTVYDTVEVTVNDTTNTLAIPVLLQAGWNMIAYLRATAMDAVAAINNISTNVLLMKNNSGQTYIPSIGVNTIGDMLPGQGYKVKMSVADTLYYPH